MFNLRDCNFAHIFYYGISSQHGKIYCRIIVHSSCVHAHGRLRAGTRVASMSTYSVASSYVHTSTTHKSQVYNVDYNSQVYMYI